MKVKPPAPGHWHNLQARVRCHFCGTPSRRVFRVNQGPTTGTFCSSHHYLRAYENMHNLNKDEEEE